MECSGAAERDDSVSMPIQPQHVVMASQESQVNELMPSQAESLMPSQSQSVDMTSQESQPERMETGASQEMEIVPLEEALKEMDTIDSSQWRMGSSWRQPENRQSSKQVKTAEIKTDLIRVQLKNRQCLPIKDAAFRAPSLPPAKQSVAIQSSFLMWQDRSWQQEKQVSPDNARMHRKCALSANIGRRALLT